ncbi:putative glycerol-3-phosphate transporter [Leptospira interrogans str. 2003000735]|uniref:Glycerol-3-phosphate antiporter n=9 Tax=Leptospira interrogans TaxID=173 RepID=Q8EZ20_LEPIN|nr:MFS transporter [Leptospira interrogans]EMF45080.1 putative glycerol-3-phosphate transporter [Leptospira interrogans serovar Lora str. TE 1992]EMF72718.1 putative glycerol-3-phosphate transporter [Leptospira interrogans serovar Canicola str. LT1962]EMG12024.1 putative glycerol-3-phosphate transporter [Leptospira interrogans serovar Grippotyphosa str. LT2186]EMM93623.1 putative glycerol-3-phosphate transporter [Leptospira interrogans serovar Zanoni str. LT2156]EMY03147.1 putative glycerol-3-
MISPLRWLLPAKAKPLLSKELIDRSYPRFRWRILEATFIGYATFYLVRNNFPVISKEMGEALHYSQEQITNILAVTAITYGIGKFLMGILSDRSNPKYFMPLGLILTAICNLFFGASNQYEVHFYLWALNGLMQGMGWPPCGRSLGHWFGVSERGSKFAIWNIAHNVGGGLVGIIAAYSASWWGWRNAFYIPALIAIVTAIYLLFRLVDTPQSVGLPPIEEYQKDPEKEVRLSIQEQEKELSFREIILGSVLKNHYVWTFAFANFFVYVVRYGLTDIGPTYLKLSKGASLEKGGISTLIYEFAGIASTLLVGWGSDKLGGKRGMVSLLCMLPILFALISLLFTPLGFLWLDLVLFGIIGFFIYPPVMLLGVAGLDFTSKKAVGAAAGFIGLFGYLGRTILSKSVGWLSKQTGFHWEQPMYLMIGATLISIALLAITWNWKPKA